MDILAAIDGTWSDTWWAGINQSGADAWDSHVHRFFTSFDSQGGRKRYFPGPNLRGSDVISIKEQVESYVRGELRLRPQARVCLVGHSRGGHIAIMVARALQGIKKVSFLGLYDAVERGSGDSETIRNVRWAYHAIRDPRRGSREFLFDGLPFGSTGRKAGMDVESYEEKLFFAAHGSIGGDLRPSGYCLNPLDRRYGAAADQWIRTSARFRGLRV